MFNDLHHHHHHHHHHHQRVLDSSLTSGDSPWPRWKKDVCFVSAWLKCSLQGNSRYLPSLRDQGQHSTWWHPLWIHVGYTCYSLSWCLRHQAHLRDCLKCVLGKQLFNNWAPSAQVNAVEKSSIRFPLRVAVQWQMRCGAQRFTVNIHNDKGLQHELPKKYSNTMACKPRSREAPWNIHDFSQFFWPDLPHPDFPNNCRENIPEGIHNLKTQAVVFQDPTHGAWRADVNIIMYKLYTPLITRCSSPFLSTVSRPTCNALATPAKEGDVGGEDSASRVWYSWENDQRFGVMRCICLYRGFVSAKLWESRFRD